MALQDEIDARAKEIHTDGYSMSINELVSLYRNREMDIHPEFQRFFRWTESQKSRLIESILLGIPIPSVFVAQREDGVWDVVDGLQRISTILEFMGELRGEDNALLPPSSLRATNYLPSLQGKVWEDEDDAEAEHALSNPQRLIIKRAKLDIRIVKRESDPGTKYELFQRLNTGGTTLSDQEVRNCLLIMVNRDFYGWLSSLQSDPNFELTVALSDRQRIEQYDLELVLRFMACRNSTNQELGNISDLGDFLTQKMMTFAQDGTFNRAEEEAVFRMTFKVIGDALSDDAFRRYDKAKDRFMGGFSVSSFETITVGVAENISAWETMEVGTRNSEMIRRVAELWWNDEVFRSRSGTGVRAGTRIPYLVPHGKSVFKVA